MPDPTPRPEAAPAAAAPTDARVVRAWCLYDLGNSSFAVLFPVIYSTYYAGSVVGGGRGDAIWGVLVALSMLTVAVISPYLGGVADHAGVRKRLLGGFTLLGIVAVLAIPTVGTGDIAWGFVVGWIAGVAFEGGIVFYNAYLPDIAPRSHQGRVSALGYAWGYVGSLLALGLALVAVKVGWSDGIWVALAVQWGLAAWHALRVLPRDVRTATTLRSAGTRGLASTWQTFKSLWGSGPLGWFLLAYLFYMDGVLTVVHFAPLFAKRTLAFSQGELIALVALVQVSALIGSLAMAGPSDRRGPRWAVRVLLVWWIGVVIAAAVVQGKLAFFGVAFMAGLGLGSVQSVSRAYMARLIPAGREAELFGFYALCGKSGAIMGPLLFGLLSWTFGSQRPAVLAVGVFFVLGLVILGRVAGEPPTTPAGTPQAPPLG